MLSSTNFIWSVLEYLDPFVQGFLHIFGRRIYKKQLFCKFSLMQTRNIKFFETSLKKFSSYSFLEKFIDSTQGPIATIAAIQNEQNLFSPLSDILEKVVKVLRGIAK